MSYTVPSAPLGLQSHGECCTHMAVPFGMGWGREALYPGFVPSCGVIPGPGVVVCFGTTLEGWRFPTACLPWGVRLRQEKAGVPPPGPHTERGGELRV